MPSKLDYLSKYTEKKPKKKSKKKSKKKPKTSIINHDSDYDDDFYQDPIETNHDEDGPTLVVTDGITIAGNRESLRDNNKSSSTSRWKEVKSQNTDFSSDQKQQQRRRYDSDDLDDDQDVHKAKSQQRKRRYDSDDLDDDHVHNRKPQQQRMRYDIDDLDDDHARGYPKSQKQKRRYDSDDLDDDHAYNPKSQNSNRSRKRYDSDDQDGKGANRERRPRRKYDSDDESKEASELPQRKPRRYDSDDNDRMHLNRRRFDSDNEEKVKNNQTIAKSRRAGRHDSDNDMHKRRESRRYDSDDDDKERDLKGYDSGGGFSSRRRRERHDSEDEASAQKRGRSRYDSDDEEGRGSTVDNKARRHGKVLNHSDEDGSADVANISETNPTRKMTSGHSAGLQTSSQFKEAEQNIKKKNSVGFEDLKRGDTVYRDKDGRMVDVNVKSSEKVVDDKDSDPSWNLGTEQKRRMMEYAQQKQTARQGTFARSIDDADKHTRDAARDGDPMAKQSRPNGSKKVYKGPQPQPNRFGIRPGYRWDGIDRGNGFEDQVLAATYAKGRKAEERYKWSCADM